MSAPVSGAQEARRRRRAAPDPLGTRPFPPGCLVKTSVYLVGCAIGWAVTRSAVSIVLGAPALILLTFAFVRFVTELGLLVRVRAEWATEQIRCLVVHSNSERWDGYIRSRWFPRFGSGARYLNWSERSKWEPGSLEVRVFRRFCGTRDFNPAVIVFRGLRTPLVFRFYHAFREAEHGRRVYLDDLEKQMFEALEA